ncbi:hypothetical protein ABE444_11495 [Brevundimonas pondensis]|uniref:hypothetical protein n=1 Tax=Brevundimonas pondensis TaxID=2774189 RepID=UPI00320B93CB
MSLLPINRPVALATDFGATVFENLDLSLHDVFAHAARNGTPMIHGRTFRGCRIQGPAIALVSSGVTFDDTNFGDSRGDIRNLVLRPVGDKAIGTVPLRDCIFIGCEFYGVGFTGTDEFIAQVIALPNSL